MTPTEVFLFERKQKTLTSVEILDRMIVLSRDVGRHCFVVLRPGQWFSVTALKKHHLYSGFYLESQQEARVENWDQYERFVNEFWRTRRKGY